MARSPVLNWIREPLLFHRCVALFILSSGSLFAQFVSSQLNMNLLGFKSQCANAICPEINFYLKFLHVQSCSEYAAHLQYAHRHSHSSSCFKSPLCELIEMMYFHHLLKFLSDFFLYCSDERKQTKKFRLLIFSPRIRAVINYYFLSLVNFQIIFQSRAVQTFFPR